MIISTSLRVLGVVLVVMLMSSACMARPLDRFNIPENKEFKAKDFKVSHNIIYKGFRGVFSMLPKGPVTPSGPSPVHNSVPVYASTDDVQP